MLLLVGLTGRVAAAGKPTVAILGVEVTDPSNQGIDQTSTETAKGLTEGLRSRAKAGTGPLTLAPGSDKELIDEKMLNSCDTEANACMAKIGADLAADQLMFGNIQKKSTGYLVTLKLLGVSGKNIIRSVNETIPYADAQGAALQSWAKKIYGKLTGDNSGGILVIKANVERGTVLIESEPKGNLVGGRATISGLAEGRYKLAIEAEGYQRFETTVTINAGETTNAGATLDPSGLKGGAIKPVIDTGTGGSNTGGGSSGRPIELGHSQEGTVSESSSNIWKPIAIASVIVAAGGAAFWTVGDLQEQSAAKKVTLTNNGKGLTDADCGNAAFAADSNFKTACSRKTWTEAGIGITAGAGVIAAVSIVMALRHNDDEHPTAANTVGSRKHHDRFAVTPIILPNGGGATLQLDW